MLELTLHFLAGLGVMLAGLFVWVVVGFFGILLQLDRPSSGQGQDLVWFAVRVGPIATVLGLAYMIGSPWIPVGSGRRRRKPVSAALATKVLAADTLAADRGAPSRR